MGINRRRSNRRKFKLNKNYIIPFVCVVITCATLIISTNVITNLKQELSIQTNNGQIAKIIQIEDNQKKQINDTISFLMSNLDIGQDLTSDYERYLLVCKYFGKDNTFTPIENQYIDSIQADVYRNLGYVYFDDFKDEYMYITKQDFVSTYEKLFYNEILNESAYTQYYISQLNGYVVPKNNEIYDSSRYKLESIKYDEENDEYIVNLLEINVLKLYEQVDYDKVLEYLENIQIDTNYLTGKNLTLKLKKVNDIFVFKEYGI